MQYFNVLILQYFHFFCHHHCIGIWFQCQNIFCHCGERVISYMDQIMEYFMNEIYYIVIIIVTTYYPLYCIHPHTPNPPPTSTHCTHHTNTLPYPHLKEIQVTKPQKTNLLNTSILLITHPIINKTTTTNINNKNTQIMILKTKRRTQPSILCYPIDTWPPY